MPVQRCSNLGECDHYPRLLWIKFAKAIAFHSTKRVQMKVVSSPWLIFKLKYSSRLHNMGLEKHDQLIWTNSLAGLNSIGASSDKCDNFKNVRIVDTLWYENILRGVSLLPKMQLSVNEWTTFSMKSPHLNPLFCSKAHLTEGLDDSDVVYILLEAGIYPDIHAITNGSDVVSVNYLGLCVLTLESDWCSNLFSNRLNDSAIHWHGKSIHVWLSSCDRTFHCTPNS